MFHRTGYLAQVTNQGVFTGVAFHVITALLAVEVVLAAIALQVIIAKGAGRFRRLGHDGHANHLVKAKAGMAQPHIVAVYRPLDTAVIGQQHIILVTAVHDIVTIQQVGGRRASASQAICSGRTAANHIVLAALAKHPVRAVVAFHGVVTAAAVHQVTTAIFVNGRGTIGIGGIGESVAVIISAV